MRDFLRILTFLVVGPAVGTLAFVFGGSLYSWATSGKSDDVIFMAGHIFTSPFVFAFGYLLGGIPSVLSGIAASVMARQMPPGWRYRLWVGVAGAIASVVGTIWLAVPRGFGDDRGPISVWAFIAVIAVTGALAAFVSALAFDGLSRLRRRTA